MIVDPMSLRFLKGAVVDYTTEMMRSSFTVVSNPNAQSSCGCHSSFAVKKTNA